jgi:hypothetical protein
MLLIVFFKFLVVQQLRAAFFKKNYPQFFHVIHSFKMQKLPSKSKYPPGDRMNATFRMAAYQAERVAPFVGYSKMVGNAEAQDKDHVLEQYIFRMLRNGYLERSYCIEFYTNYQQGNDQDTLLVTLLDHEYVLGDDALTNPYLKNTLDRFYAKRSNPNTDNAMIANRERAKSGLELMFSMKRKFFSKEDLIKHGDEILRKYGEGQRLRLRGWYNQMISINNL